MEDARDARGKKHSTFAEAVETAKYGSRDVPEKKEEKLTFKE